MFFSTKDKMEEHVKNQTGKVHDRYRTEHGIPFLGYKPEPFPPMVAPPASPPPLPPNQTDIRSFSFNLLPKLSIKTPIINSRNIYCYS